MTIEKILAWVVVLIGLGVTLYIQYKWGDDPIKYWRYR